VYRVSSLHSPQQEPLKSFPSLFSNFLTTMLLHRSSSVALLTLALSSCKALQTRSLNPQSRMILWCNADSHIHAPLPPNVTVSDVATTNPTVATSSASTTLSLEQLLSPVRGCDVTQMGPTAWAYVGDVVFELFVRSQMVWPTRRTSDLQEQVVSLVRGECFVDMAGGGATMNMLTPFENVV
jgi:hypothetical protein